MVEAPTLADFVAAWPLFRDPVLCAVFAGAVLGWLGVHVVLRRMVFFAATLSQAAGLGVALAFYAGIHAGVHVHPVVGAAVASLITAGLASMRAERLHLSRDALLAFAWLVAFVNLLSAVLAVSATLFYVFVYTLWLKRTSTQNIVIGGAAGAVPVLVGWSAVTNSLGWAPIVLFLVIFYWTPPHFWALAIRYRDDYAKAEVPMLPVVASLETTARRILFYTVILVALTLVFAPVADMGAIYLASALALGAVFTAFALSLRRDPSEGTAMRLFTYSITYVTLLFGAIVVDVVV